jgi:hypothetical protein
MKHCTLSDGPIFLLRTGLTTPSLCCLLPDRFVVSSHRLFAKGHPWDAVLCEPTLFAVKVVGLACALCFVLLQSRQRGAFQDTD